MLKGIAQFLGFAGRAAASAPAPSQHRLRGKFDAAQTTPENRRHWQNADHLAADAACNPAVRRTLRSRARYEQFNNPYADGQLQTLAADMVGRGPRLQLVTDDRESATYVENQFTAWMRRVMLGEKLLIAVETTAAAGECFVLRHTNPKLRSQVKLDIKLLEGDQVASPQVSLPFVDPADGIEFDRFDNPEFYTILRRHPGDLAAYEPGPPSDRVPAEMVLHLFRPRRPGQSRGVPQIASSLPLFAERRGFRQSILSAARKVAELGAITVESDAADNEAPQPIPFEELELTAGMMTVLPAGWKGKQMEPTQPGTTYREFDDKLINEAARPLSMPFNIAACNSSSYNYASGRLDHQTYDRMLDVDHGRLEARVLDRVLDWWLDEAKRIPGYLPASVLAAIASDSISYKWLWRGRPHVDPVAEAEAEAKRLASRTTSLTDELASEGQDLESHLQTLGRESQAVARAGLAYPTALTGPQLQQCLAVLTALGAKQIASVAAVELLIAVGIPRTWALAMVSQQPEVKAPTTPTPAKAPATDPNSGTDTTAAAPSPAGRLHAMGLNGTSNGVHAHE
jgi:lambda family phage portal protein